MKINPVKDDLLRMIKRYVDGNATTAERQFVEKYYQQFENDTNILDEYDQEQKADLEKEMEQILMRRINNEDRVVRPLWQRNVFRFLTAASVLCVLGVFLYKSGNFVSRQANSVAIALKDVDPGSDKAVLTLSDGSSIMLDDTSRAHLATEGIVSIRTNGNGELEYTRSGLNTGIRVAGMNTITTPVGGQYRVVLPDGSKVWLNAMSSLSYPTYFNDDQRKVRVTGECYFEIAKDTRHPFVVEIDNKQQVVVTGTHFNVNAYPNEGHIRTTLLEGGVEVSRLGSSNQHIRLMPGMQSYTDAEGNLEKHEVDAAEMVAWKNGLFQFHNADLGTVMRQIERWYNVEVTYENGKMNKEFSGKIHRKARLSQILEILKFTGINIRMEAAHSKDANGRIVLIP